MEECKTFLKYLFYGMKFFTEIKKLWTASGNQHAGVPLLPKLVLCDTRVTQLYPLQS